MLPYNEEDICRCDCHEPGSTTHHISPCCEMCPNCGQLIKIHSITLHAHSCKPKKFDHQPGGQVIGEGEDDGP